MTTLDRFKGWRICTCEPHAHICPFCTCKPECRHPLRATEVDLWVASTFPGAPKLRGAGR